MEFQQRTTEWFRDRIGRWNASEIGNLMKRDRCGNFGDTALSYIRKVAAERLYNENVVADDYMLASYLEATTINSKAMQWGTDNEVNARTLYSKLNHVEVVEVGSIEHLTIPNFSASPDGIAKYKEEDVGIEIKCPKVETFMQYKVAFQSYSESNIKCDIFLKGDDICKISTRIKELEDKISAKETRTARAELDKLKVDLAVDKSMVSIYEEELKDRALYNNRMLLDINPMYYWQIQAQMMCVGLDKVDFVVYHPIMKQPILINRIKADTSSFSKLAEAIQEAEIVIKQMTE